MLLSIQGVVIRGIRRCCIHCSNEDEWCRIGMLLHEAGYRWVTSGSIVKEDGSLWILESNYCYIVETAQKTIEKASLAWITSHSYNPIYQSEEVYDVT